MYKSQRFDLIIILIMEICCVEYFLLCQGSYIANHDSNKENIVP